MEIIEHGKKTPEVETIHIGKGRGEGHDHLCLNIAGRFIYAHVCIEGVHNANVAFYFYEATSLDEMSHDEINWKVLPTSREVSLNLVSF